MLEWFLAEDKAYYENLEKFKNKEYSTVVYDEIIVLPTDKEIKRSLLSQNRIAFLSPILPPLEFINVVIVKKLKNLKGVLTTQEESAGITIPQSIESKLGLKTIEPELTFSNLGGAKMFKDWASRVDIAKEKGILPKPVFFLGVPGVGKTFSVQCYAGEKNLPMLELNIELILEKPNPISVINSIFEYFDDTGIECILLMDEIEQMLQSKAMLGQLLTILSNLNTPEGYKLNGVLFATSNNVKDLVYNFPQFFRHGRWSEKFFNNYPSKEEALAVMKLYASKFKVNIDDSMIEKAYILANQYYKKYNLEEKRSVYAQSEIAYLFEKLTAYLKIDDKILMNEIAMVDPLQVTAQQAIQKLIADSRSNKFKEM
ncbi:MAG: Unknown protein [uncultured Sulfurovum sp.]|uniref:ATPase AAA-type core domain-containing protein n=1 Tax=uncultured Sulfurovum sp. TaxID=269237 RepID=A0A6S6TRV7_9BACT|nr:MAG: Unknown protein [uncultured Sulfurovum sp.]